MTNNLQHKLFDDSQYTRYANAKVQKRDGRLVNFDMHKMSNAIKKAIIAQTGSFDEYGSYVLDRTMLYIDSAIDHDVQIGTTTFTIEELQNIVEAHLHLVDADIGNCYKTYRLKRDEIRQKNRDVNHQVGAIERGDETVNNENANKDANVFNTNRDKTAGQVAKVIGLQMLPPHVANAHEKGDIHFHDLDYSPHLPLTNCCLIDFEEMLKNGFRIGNADVDSPKSIGTATAQIAQIIANVASNQYGGCSADRIDEILSPYAELNYEKNLKKISDISYVFNELASVGTAGNQNRFNEFLEQKATEWTIKDIYDAVQALEYEINTLFSSQGQTPFTTLGFGLGTGKWEREIQKAILKIRILGLGAEKRTAIFPKLVFTLKRGINLEKEDPNYDIKMLALECATKRMYPDVLSYDKIVELTGSFKVPMGCRSFLQGWKDQDGNEVNAGRMNLGVVTLNLPRIALESEGDFTKFWNILEERLEICHDALLYRVERAKQAIPKNAPILYKYGAFGKRLSDNDKVDEVFKNKRATVSLGYIGLYEVATVFFGGEWEENQTAKNFTLKVLEKLYQKTVEWGNMHGYHFSVYSTPSESLTDRFCRMDKEKFGTVTNITDKDYYTNSFHYDVRKNPTPFEKIDFEKDYPKFASGGFIHYCEYPVLQQNPKALEAVWDFAYDKVGYLGTNTPIDKCYECGFEGDFLPTAKGFKCPNCNNRNPATCDVVKRTCGYLGNPQMRPMVKGRHKEIKSRVKHMR